MPDPNSTPQTVDAQPPGTTEVVSSLRAWTYAEAAHKLGQISVEVVAEPGDTITVSEPQNGFRTHNPRELGDLVGVNLPDQPGHPKVKNIEVAEDHKGIVVTSPLKDQRSAGDRQSLYPLYELSNQLYDTHKAELSKKASD